MILIKIFNFCWKIANKLIKDKVLIMVGCPIFSFYGILIAKYLFTGSLKNRSIDNLETQKKYIQWKIPNSLIIYSMQNRNKLEIKKSLSTKLPTEERRTVGKMNGTIITNRIQNSFKIKDNNVYGSSYYWNFIAGFAFDQLIVIFCIFVLF